MEDQSGKEHVVFVKGPSNEDPPQRNESNVSSVAWAVAAIAWAIAIYLIEREKQWAQVEVARLEMEAKSR